MNRQEVWLNEAPLTSKGLAGEQQTPQRSLVHILRNRPAQLSLFDPGKIVEDGPVADIYVPDLLPRARITLSC